MVPQTFVFAGPSGSGKGTQVKKLTEELNKLDSREQFYFSTGDHFRAYMKDRDDTTAARLSKEINEHGGLQPPFLAIWLWAGAFVENIDDDTHLIVDGSPRTVTEAQALDSAFRFFKRPSPHVIVIEVSDEVAKQRLLKRARKDDTEDSIENRLRWYNEEVKPALEIYRDNDYYQYHAVDGDKPVEEVHSAIMDAISLQS